VLGLSRGGEHAPPSSEHRSRNAGPSLGDIRPMLLVVARRRAPSSLQHLVNHTRCSRSERGGAHPRGSVRERSPDGMALHLRAGQPAAEGAANRGDSPALEEDRRLDGRARVSESCCRDRLSGSRPREAYGKTHSPSEHRAGRRRGLHLEVSITDFVARRGPRASSDRATPSSDQAIT